MGQIDSRSDGLYLYSHSDGASCTMDRAINCLGRKPMLQFQDVLRRQMPMVLVCLILIAFVGVARVLVASAEEAQADAIDPFVGEYVGRTLSNGEGEIEARDASVTIEKADGGFVIKWTTVTHRANGRAKRKSHSVRFQATDRDSLFSSAMKRDKFGGLTPLDPLKGEPYVWAKIEGKTLRVHAMIITETGGYEMQIYDRTLTDSGLRLNFSRVRDGEILRDITANLAREKS